jgi:putative hemolysin
MKKIAIMALMVTALILGGCGSKAKPTTFDSPMPTPEPGIANPASQYCVDQGGQLEIRTAADGSQTGYCLFADGSECEEWAYYRGECKPGKK